MVEPEPRPGAAESAGEADDRYLVVGVVPERLRQFRSGAIDLRSLLVGSDEEERYVTTVRNGMEHALEIERLTIPLIESGHLPDEGLLLRDRASSSVLGEARERNNPAVENIAESPEAAAFRPPWKCIRHEMESTS